MTSNSDDLEEQLRENLKLRRQLAAEVDRTRDNASQRVSRGFHRLGLLLAASLFVIGLAFVVADLVRVGGLLSLDALIMRAAIGFVGLCWACVALYGLIRAIGWVIGRFMAS